MAEPCLFCDNPSGSREHLWPAWIHKRKDFGALRMRRGDGPEVILPNPQQTVKTVCGKCNNGWMSALEAENIPIIGSMFQDLSIPLDETQQQTVAVWAVKTTMMFESTKGRKAENRFYTKDEGINLRVGRQIPNLTRVWLARIAGSHLNHSGTDFELLSDSARIGIATVSTIILGNFIAQVVTIHPGSELFTQPEITLHPKPGDWDNLTLSIWPVERPWVTWPPKVSFTNGGLLGIGHLLVRWNGGTKVAKITKDSVVE
jgi:hypothetical protein